MLLQDHPTVQSNLPFAQATASNTGIIHASLSTVLKITHQYWIMTRAILPAFTQYCQELGYNVIYFTSFSSKVAWLRLCMGIPITNMIAQKPHRDGAIHNSVLLLDVHVSDPFNPGQFIMKCAHKPNVSAYHTDETTSTEKRLDDGSTLTPIVSAIRRSHTDESDLQKSSAPPFSK